MGKKDNNQNKNKETNKQTNKPRNDNRNPKQDYKPNENVTPDGKKKGCQDPFWYATDQKAIDNMASFPFLEVVGDTIGNSSDKVAGLMRMSYRHCISNTITGGTFKSSGNYATRAAKTYYNYVTQGFTGSVDFEAPDLMMTALAGNSLFALLIEGKRAYAAMDYYLQFNQYYAKTVVEGLGFSYDSLLSNKANFRAEFNIRARQINKLIAVPKKFFIGDRWEFLAGNLFLDTNSPEYATLMAYVCEDFLQYDATAAKTGTCLRWYPRQQFTYETYFATVDALISSLDDDDVRSIFGAIRRVYSDGDLKQVTDLQEGIEIAIVKNDIVSAAIHNMSWSGSTKAAGFENVIGYLPKANVTEGVDLTDAPIYQDATGNIVCAIYQRQGQFIPYSGGSVDKDVLLDMYDHLVSPGNVLDITASIQVSLKDDPTITLTSGSNNAVYSPLRCRSEVYTGIQMVVLDDDESYSLRAVDKGGASAYPISVNNATFFHVDSHPLICCTSSMSPTYSSDIQFYIGEIDKYTVLSRRDIAQLHDRCMYNMLLLPENTKSVTK